MQPIPRAGLVVGTLALLLAAGCTKKADRAPTARPPSTPALTTAGPAASPTQTGAGVQPGIVFSDCSPEFQRSVGTSRAKKMRFSCGKLAVPVDYRRPTGAKLNLFVLKVHAEDQDRAQRLGSLLINPGGPGVSGVTTAAGLVSALSDGVFARFDLVGFDPRGVGLSAPVQCITDKQKDALTAQNIDARTAAGRVAARAASDAIAKACVAKYGATLGHFNTEETARDLDLIRQGLGDAKLNYLGFSYGTRLGAAYAHLFPAKVRVAVLDGAVDPVASELTTDERQVQGFEKAFDQFAADCRARPACAALGDPRAAVAALIRSADGAPIRSARLGETRLANGGVVLVGTFSALYNQDQWKNLGDALLAARAGDSAKLFGLADAYTERDPATGHYTNVQDANLAINCNDSTLAVSDALVAAKAADWTAKYPLFGANAAASLYACHAWPKSGHPVPPASAPTSPPILVLGTVHDPATPYAASAVLAKALGTGVVLSWDGEGHTAYPKTPCITAKVNSYLFTTKIPAGDSCPTSS